MPNNHRGNYIAPNHRPTPRVAQVVERHLNRKIEEATDQLHYDQPLLGYSMAGQATTVQAGNGQHILNRYRDLRDKTAQYRSRGITGGPNQIDNDAENIREALNSRSNY